MKRRDVEITQMDGSIVILLSREPMPLSLPQLALENGYRMQAICDRIGISERHLRRVFEDGIGMSPKEWLRQERMVTARKLLRSGTSIKEVAIDLGFTNAKMLSRDFLEYYGVRPTEFQKKESDLILKAIR